MGLVGEVSREVTAREIDFHCQDNLVTEKRPDSRSLGVWVWNKTCLLWVQTGCQECHSTGSVPAQSLAPGDVDEHQ